jgi:hypothetical protein
MLHVQKNVHACSWTVAQAGEIEQEIALGEQLRERLFQRVARERERAHHRGLLETACVRRHVHFEQIVGGHRVVVEEDHERRARVLDAEIARSAGTGVRLAQHAQLERVRGGIDADRLGRAVVDEDHLELCRIERLRIESNEHVPDALGPSVGRHDDRKTRGAGESGQVEVLFARIRGDGATRGRGTPTS